MKSIRKLSIVLLLLLFFGCKLTPDNENPLAPLSTPENFQTNSQIKSINLSWDAVENASGYEISWALSENDTYIACREVTGTSTLVKGLNSTDTYYFKIRALASGRNSNWSNAVNGTPLRPDAPDNIDATAYETLLGNWVCTSSLIINMNEGDLLSFREDFNVVRVLKSGESEYKTSDFQYISQITDNTYSLYSESGEYNVGSERSFIYRIEGDNLTLTNSDQEERTATFTKSVLKPRYLQFSPNDSFFDNLTQRPSLHNETNRSYCFFDRQDSISSMSPEFILSKETLPSPYPETFSIGNPESIILSSSVGTNTLDVLVNERVLEGNNLLYNGNFEDGGSFWYFTKDLYYTTDCSIDMNNGYAEVIINSNGGSEVVYKHAWNTLLTYRNFQDLITFEEGKLYKLSFDAKSSNYRDLTFSIGGRTPLEGDFLPPSYLSKSIILRQNWESFSSIFSTGDYSTDNSPLFNFGCSLDTGSVFIDNLKIEEFTLTEDMITGKWVLNEAKNIPSHSASRIYSINENHTFSLSENYDETDIRFEGSWTLSGNMLYLTTTDNYTMEIYIEDLQTNNGRCKDLADSSIFYLERKGTELQLNFNEALEKTINQVISGEVSENPTPLLYSFNVSDGETYKLEAITKDDNNEYGYVGVYFFNENHEQISINESGDLIIPSGVSKIYMHTIIIDFMDLTRQQMKYQYTLQLQ